uniref:Uncharacterized protein n=1 Tax=Acrobeloides nanus TaxID=290746 RepID=A0A914CGX2_9BILA
MSILFASYKVGVLPADELTYISVPINNNTTMCLSVQEQIAMVKQRAVNTTCCPSGWNYFNITNSCYLIKIVDKIF